MHGLLTDLYQLTMAAGYFEAGKASEKATFELFIRQLPPGRSFVVAAGLEQAVEYLLNLSFSADEIDYLKGLPQFARASPAFFESLERLLPALARLTRHVASRSIPLISTADAHTENCLEFADWPSHCVAGTWGQKKAACTVLEGALVLPSSAGPHAVEGAAQSCAGSNMTAVAWRHSLSRS